MEMNDAKLIEFTHIPPEAGVWRQVLDLGTRLRFRKGEEIMHGGEKGEYLYYVHQGEARLIRTTLDGREKMLRPAAGRRRRKPVRPDAGAAALPGFQSQGVVQPVGKSEP